MASDNKVDRRAKSILNRLVAGRQLSEQGMDWLIAAMDPFHDTEVCLEGYPDIVSSRSITQCVQKTTTVTKPTGLTGDWDCHLFFIPAVELRNQQFFRASINSQAQLASVSGQLNSICGGLNIIKCGPNENWDRNGQLQNDLRIPKAYSSYKHRLIGVGYEVRNVTAPLYKQGSVTCYKQPMQWSQGRSTETTGNPKLFSPTSFTELPPYNAAGAALYPNSRIWDAAEGCYNIVTLNDVENPVTAAVPKTVVLSDVDFSAIPGATGDLAFAILPTDECAAVVYPYDNVGAVFSGLSEQTALQVTVRYLYERFPTEDNADLLVLARPPSPYDPLALELYARCLRELPSFVMVKDNPLGEWFGKVLETVANIAPVIGKVLPFPGAALIGDVVGKGAGAAASVLRPSPAAPSSSAPGNQSNTAHAKKKNKKSKK